ncbi:tRNA (cytidine(34)-2'-O)-methyltransferase [Vulgatibacter incomptus]|uniref:Putative tRNA (cytidine(34)-2'-O)-methyltransferase n=1 Tax=Vulgatibacter incomptus TaxID=1391653 RepID=A0A0K1PE59_9BACT|nr:tRNA (cytidine(34)-2'-O)-methyltransferase [Vulgatibacter incomptus]AKU91823.1 tRNA (cytidine(34)-2'-O)-methyltransferase [Vulgatibacter incomptus]
MLPDLDPPFSVVLVHPQIPPNTGNIARLCAVTGSRLHLVEPLGFSIADKDLRRAGLDYWDRVVARIHPDVESWEASAPFPRVHLFTGRASRTLWETDFQPGDQLVFGSEPHGLPPELLERHADRTVSIPQQPGLRSLNLSTAAGIAVYEALRQVLARGPKGG